MSVASILSGTPAVLDSHGSSMVNSSGVTNGASPQYFDVRGGNSGDAGVITLSTTLGAHSSLYLEGTGAGGGNEVRLVVSNNDVTLGPDEGAVQLYTQSAGAVPAGANLILRSGDPRGADRRIMYADWAPDDPARAGYTPALAVGANVILCPSITAASIVLLSVAGPAAALAAGAAVPVVANAAGVSFTITAVAAQVGTIYSYLVIG